MLYVFIPKDFDLITKIQEGIAKEENTLGSIRTWQYSKYFDKYTWVNSNLNNWPDLHKKAYFKAENCLDKDGDKYVRFTLHAKHGISLSKTEYSRMHSELLYMIMAHFGRTIDEIGVSKVPANNADIQD